MMKKMVPVSVVVLAMTVAIFFTPSHCLAFEHPAGWVGATMAFKKPSPNYTTQFLETHNKARAAVGVAPLKWSPSLANSAEDIAWAMITNVQEGWLGCNRNLDYSRSLKQRHGFSSYNLHWERDRTPTPSQVVNKWVAMKKYYNYARNSCVRNSNCSTYTQVVWRNSLELGCSQEICLNKPGEHVNGITLCLYSPPGNVPGERPY